MILKNYQMIISRKNPRSIKKWNELMENFTPTIENNNNTNNDNPKNYIPPKTNKSMKDSYIFANDDNSSIKKKMDEAKTTLLDIIPPPLSVEEITLGQTFPLIVTKEDVEHKKKRKGRDRKSVV